MNYIVTFLKHFFDSRRKTKIFEKFEFSSIISLGTPEFLHHLESGRIRILDDDVNNSLSRCYDPVFIDTDICLFLRKYMFYSEHSPRLKSGRMWHGSIIRKKKGHIGRQCEKFAGTAYIVIADFDSHIDV